MRTGALRMGSVGNEQLFEEQLTPLERLRAEGILVEGSSGSGLVPNFGGSFRGKGFFLGWDIDAPVLGVPEVVLDEGGRYVLVWVRQNS